MSSFHDFHDLHDFQRVTLDPEVLGGCACVRNLKIPVWRIVMMIAYGMTREEIIEEYPDLEADDIHESLRYAAWLAEETTATWERVA
jgi:uncharacterized protein (DUF433 family)